MGTLFLLATIMLFVLPGSAISRFAGLVIMLLLPGFALWAIMKGTVARSAEMVLFAGAISPILWFVPAALLLLAGYGAGEAFKSLAVIYLAVLWWGIVAGKPGNEQEGIGRTALIIAAAATLLIVFPFIVSNALKLRSDAWFHAAVAELISRKGIPPTDPLYAGIGLKYFWAYHVELILMQAASGLSHFDSMAVLDVVFFALYLKAIYLLSSRISRSSSGPLWSMLIAILGVNAVGCLLLLGRAFLGDIKGIAVFDSILNGGVYTVLQNMSFHYTGSLGFFLDKFLVGSSFGPTLVFFLLTLRSIVVWLESGDRRECILAGIWYVSALLFHTVVGLTILIAGILSCGVMLLLYRKAEDPLLSRRLSWALAVLVIFTLLAAPYLYTILSFSDRGGGLPLTFNTRFLWTVLCAGFLPLVLMLAGWLKSPGTKTSVVFIMLFAAGALALGTFARMPLGNANKFVYIVFLAIIVCAGDGVPAASRMLERTGRFRYVIYAAVALCAAGTLAIGIAGYALDDGTDIPVRAGRGGLQLLPAEVEAYDWIGRNTPAGSIFINGSRRDLPVLGPREQLWTDGRFAEVWGYGTDAISWREEVVRELYAGRPLPAGSIERLSSLGGPVYIVLRPGDGPLSGKYRQVFGNESFQIFEILP
jgi:hypothetical protein